LGRFGLDTTSRSRPLSGSAEVTVELVDRSARVAEDRFEAPAQTVVGATVVAEIRRLIQDSLGTGIPVNDLTGSTQIAARLDIARDRWADGIEKLADAIGAEVFFDVLGNGVIRSQPTLTDVPVWTVTSGAEDSILLTTKETLTRQSVYNKVVASGQRTDGTPPVYAAVVDDDPTSPTRYGGPFGRKPRFYSSPLLTTVGQCTTAAEALLERVRGLGVQVEISTLVNPALDAGDVIQVIQNGVATTHIVDKLSVPLTPDGPQPLSTRSGDMPPAEE
jgi:hypothetical protein